MISSAHRILAGTGLRPWSLHVVLPALPVCSRRQTFHRFRSHHDPAYPGSRCMRSCQPGVRITGKHTAFGLHTAPQLLLQD